MGERQPKTREQKLFRGTAQHIQQHGHHPEKHPQARKTVLYISTAQK